MYSRILVPTNGSDGAIEAIEVGLDVAKLASATVHALYVIDTRFVVTGYDFVVQKDERALKQVEERGTEAGIPVRKHVRKGIPHVEIIDAIDAYDCDAVMGTHGRTGIDRFVHVGSVTERVVRAAPVHVITVPFESPG